MLQENKSENAPERKSGLVNKPLSMSNLERTSLNKKFNTGSFSSLRKEVNKATKDYVKLMRKCSQAIAYNLVATEKAMDVIQDKMAAAKEKGKNSTNIYEVDLYERALLITESYLDKDGEKQTEDFLYRITRENLEKGYLEYRDVHENIQTIEVSEDVGISVVDLIKGPRGDEKWMLRNRVQTVPEILQESFRSSCTSDIMDDILEAKNKERPENSEELTLESFQSVTWSKLIDNYVKENDFIFPEIYYHFNRHWGTGLKKGKFAIELDWSGSDPKDHSGVRAGQVSERRGRRNDKNRDSPKTLSERRPRRRRTRNSQKEVKEFV